MSAIHGQKGEYAFTELMLKHKIGYDFINDWYDFEVNSEKVEIKSCNITVCNGRKGKEESKRMLGRFDFTDQDNRDLQHENNIWIVFVVRHWGQYIFLGGIRSKNLPNKRYLSITEVCSQRLIEINDWIALIKK